jgi:tetratricopeptide (TPR) repeat protein
MSGQIFRWGMAFAATATLSASILLSAAKAPAPAAAETTVAKRDPATVTDLELELILNKIREGDLLAQKNDAAGSRRAWQEARRLGEGLWPIHEGLADSFARAKLYDDALREYQLASTLVPEKLAGMRQTIAAKRAGALASAGRPLEAIQGYLDLNQPAVFGSRIAALALESKGAAAIGVIERHAEVYDARLFKLVAGLQSRLDHKAESAEALAKYAMRVAPWDGNVNRPVLAALREARRFDAAVEVCRAWVRAVPQALEGYELMGDVLWDSGREREAMVAYSSIVDIHPGDAAAASRLGEIYLRRNRPDEALAQFERGLKFAPQDAGLRSRIVPAYLARLEKLKGEGKRDEVTAVRRTLAELNVLEAGLFDIKVTITWDAMSDVDLDVVEPDGTKINHSSRASKFGGVYYSDNTKGLGPETYTLPKAVPGAWRVGAHLHSGARSVVKFVIILHEDTPKEERREETITLETTGENTTFVRDVVIP